MAVNDNQTRLYELHDRAARIAEIETKLDLMTPEEIEQMHNMVAILLALQGDRIATAYYEALPSAALLR